RPPSVPISASRLYSSYGARSVQPVRHFRLTRTIKTAFDQAFGYYSLAVEQKTPFGKEISCDEKNNLRGNLRLGSVDFARADPNCADTSVTERWRSSVRNFGDGRANQSSGHPADQCRTARQSLPGTHCIHAGTSA